MSEQQTEQQPQFALERVYLKDMSFEVPTAAVFTAEWQPEIDVKLSTNAEPLDSNHLQVVLSVTVTAKNQETVAYIAEVHQGGIFMIENIPEDQLPHLAGAYCPSILFPFAREAISDLVTRGSFPQLLLQPINFDAAFAENLAQQNQVEGNA